MSNALAQAIFNAQDLKTEVVSVPEWGVEVTFRQLSAKNMLALTEDMDKTENKGLGMFLIIIACAINEDGTPLFSLEDLPALQQKSLPVLNRLQRVALVLNSMIAEDGPALKKG